MSIIIIIMALSPVLSSTPQPGPPTQFWVPPITKGSLAGELGWGRSLPPITTLSGWLGAGAGLYFSPMTYGSRASCGAKMRRETCQRIFSSGMVATPYMQMSC